MSLTENTKREFKPPCSEMYKLHVIHTLHGSAEILATETAHGPGNEAGCAFVLLPSHILRPRASVHSSSGNKTTSCLDV